MLFRSLFICVSLQSLQMSNLWLPSRRPPSSKGASKKDVAIAPTPPATPQLDHSNFFLFLVCNCKKVARKMLTVDLLLYFDSKTSFCHSMFACKLTKHQFSGTIFCYREGYNFMSSIPFHSFILSSSSPDSNQAGSVVEESTVTSVLRRQTILLLFCYLLSNVVVMHLL